MYSSLFNVHKDSQMKVEIKITADIYHCYSTNFLGFKIYEYLSWDNHVKHALNNKKFGIYALR